MRLAGGGKEFGQKLLQATCSGIVEPHPMAQRHAHDARIVCRGHVFAKVDQHTISLTGYAAHIAMGVRKGVSVGGRRFRGYGHSEILP